MKSKILFENKHYVACLTKAGFSVQSKKTWQGKLIKKDHIQFEDYVNSFENLLDENEGQNICHYFYIA